MILLALLPTYQPVPRTTSALDPGHSSNPAAPSATTEARVPLATPAPAVPSPRDPLKLRAPVDRNIDQPKRCFWKAHEQDHHRYLLILAGDAVAARHP